MVESLFCSSQIRGSYRSASVKSRGSLAYNAMNSVETKLSDLALERDSLSPAKNLLLLTAKTLKSIKVYPVNSPVIKGQKELLNKEFQSYLATNDVLTIKIAESALKVDDQVIYEGGNRSNNLAFLLYRDGLREISFYEGLTPEELNGFLGALAENWQGSEETDVVSSLWERDFHHISYVAIDELFADLLEPGEVDSETPFKPSPEVASPVSSGRIALQEEDVKQSSGLPRWAGEGMDTSLEMGSPLLLDDKDLRKIKEIVEEDGRNFNPPREFAQALFDLLVLEDEPEKYTSILQVLERFLSELISNAEFGTACQIFFALNEIQDSSSLQPAKYRILVETVLKMARSPESIEKIRRLLRRGAIGSGDDLLKYTSFLGASSTPILIDLLMRRENQEMPPKVCDLLVEFGRESVDYLGEWVSDSRTQLVKQIVSILGQVGGKAIPYLERCLHHPDTDVRRETVRALSQIGEIAVNPLLSKFLLDPNPAVRILTAKGFGDPDPEAVEFVCRLIHQKEFRKRGIRERKALVDILRKAGSENAVATLGNSLHQRSWFRRGDSNEFKAYVVLALASIATESARKTLVEGTRMRNRKVRNACKTALQRVGETNPEGEKGKEL